MKYSLLLSPIVFLVGLAGLVYFFPWKNVSWGKIEYQPANIISVAGYAEGKNANEVASFNVIVSATNSEKQKALDMMSSDSEDIIKQVKAFGISADDIKTSSSIYQNSSTYYDSEGVQKTKPTDWNASNTIEIIYRFDSKDKVNDLSVLLGKTKATNIWGPNFSVDSSSSMEAQKKLLDAAIKDARSKAEIIAASSGRKLGKIISVGEGSNGGIMPMYGMMDKGMGGGGGGYVEPGTSNVGQTVSVVFELQ